MADVDINQIITTLKKRFTDQNQFVFWYDDSGDFADSLAEIRTGLANVADVVVMEPGQQLVTKQYLLTLPRQHKTLIYSPAAEPALDEDHLRSIVWYSGTFSADSKEILRKELGLPDELKPFVQDNMTFFANEQRRQSFARYDVTSYQKKPELAIMAVLVHLNQPIVDFFDLLQVLLTKGIRDNSALKDFEKFGVLDAFWAEISERFGYTASHPRLEELMTGLYLTVTYQQMNKDLPKSVAEYDLSAHAANVQTLVQQFSNRGSLDKQAVDNFDSIADLVWRNIDGDRLFKETKIDDLAKSDIFPRFDQRILLWIQERLQLEDMDSQLNGQTVIAVTHQRLETHYGSKPRFARLYRMMRRAWYLVQNSHRQTEGSQQGMIDDYTHIGYKTDTDYRKFMYYYQQAGMPEQFAKTKQLIESIYVNNYLDNATYAWNQVLDYAEINPKQLQRNFYRFHVAPEKNRVVVIISDAFRFEAAKELEKRLSHEDQVTGLKMDYLVTGLPSVTYLGMPMLLPHRQLSLNSKLKKLSVDGQLADSLERRQALLQKYNPKSAAYALDDLKDDTAKEIRAKFTGQEVVYIYHNQVDAIGDNKKTEDDVFRATEEAIDEIQRLITRLRTQGIVQIYVTADHGYIYRNDQLKETDKIEVPKEDAEQKSQRYLLSTRQFDLPGVSHQELRDILANDDQGRVYYPTTANVFKAVGSFNYVHGGASLQEMLVPLLEVKTTSSRSAAHDVELELFSMNRQITSLTVPLVVRQSAAISSTVIPAEFKLYFVNEQDQQISGQTMVNANSRSVSVKDRMQNVQVVLADHVYDKQQNYYLVIENMNNGEKTETPFTMDIADLNDFDF
ncbi:MULTISPECIES: BREX-1 system phosphatase PglZ type A [Lactobacillaceae]|uniref:BREX-1 system phosphatase PglZ type A n=1 Tax=Lactobacillaceae TaxID=33958 RepID=UPI0014574F9A|nr:BREX-1 system phosphatase PglZ type A [Lactobacillus sp. HBUAS51381]NLR10725.1 BREX-1 system phosphatase PglZ type A [Lactobacillus sp. HBUAS51381]